MAPLCSSWSSYDRRLTSFAITHQSATTFASAGHSKTLAGAACWYCCLLKILCFRQYAAIISDIIAAIFIIVSICSDRGRNVINLDVPPELKLCDYYLRSLQHHFILL